MARHFKIDERKRKRKQLKAIFIMALAILLFSTLMTGYTGAWFTKSVNVEITFIMDIPS